jgi:hypothetical protein
MIWSVSGVWSDLTSTHFFATPLGMKKLASVAMADDKGDLPEVDPKNIIMSSFEDLPDDTRQLYEK